MEHRIATIRTGFPVVERLTLGKRCLIATSGKRSVYKSTSLEHGNRPVQGRKVLQKIAVQNDEVGKLAFRDCANFVDDP
jgi:hypothetical protein